MVRTQARTALTAMLVAAMAVSACGKKAEDGAPLLMNIKSNPDGTPDEFAILPNKPIEMPKDLARLPEPTPGGANLVDPSPEEDAIAALGGNPRLVGRETIPASDGGVVTYASRFGVSSEIRQQLKGEDIQWRRSNRGRVLERAFGVNSYFKAYRKMTLDQHRELARLRRLGVRTVSAPPEPTGDK